MTSILLWWRRYRQQRYSTRSIRFMFPAVLGAAALFGVASTVSNDVSFVRLEMSDTVVEAGERVSMAIYVYAATPVNAVNIKLDFSSESLQVLQVDRGQSVLTIWTEEPVVTKNSVTLSGGTFKRGFIGEHKLASIDFTATKAGSASVSVSELALLAGDGAGSSVPAGKLGVVELFIFNDETADSVPTKFTTSNHLTDITGDGEVTLRDVSVFLAAWQSHQTIYDFNSDGQMTFRDFSILLARVFRR